MTNEKIRKTMNTDIKKNQKTLVIPVPIEMWESLRKISFETRTSMSKLARESLNKVIKKYEKSVDL